MNDKKLEKERAIKEMSDHLQLVKNDLIEQLSLEIVDWGHLAELIKSGDVLQSNIDKCEKQLAEVN
jgi:hypothetical protein